MRLRARAVTAAVVVLLLSRLTAGGNQGTASGGQEVTEAARLQAEKVAKQREAEGLVVAAAAAAANVDEASPAGTDEEGEGEELSRLTVWRLNGGGREWIQVFASMGKWRSEAQLFSSLPLPSQSASTALQAQTFPSSPFADSQTVTASTTTRSARLARGAYPPGSWLTQGQDLSVSASGSGDDGGGGGGEEIPFIRACATREPTRAELVNPEP
jgi:hypothetical protein